MNVSLKQKIQENIKTAMKAHDKQRLATLRLIMAQVKQKEVDERIELTDNDLIAVLEKMCKQRKESINQFTTANRLDLVEQETSELNIINEYLPKHLPENEIKQFILVAIKNTQATSIQDMGKVMTQLRSQIQGRADMAQVSQWVKQALQQASIASQKITD